MSPNNPRSSQRRWWLPLAAALTMAAAALLLWMEPKGQDQPQVVDVGSVPVTQWGDSGSFGFAPPDGSVKMPVKIYHTASPAATFRFADTLELFLPQTLELDQVSFIRVTTETFKGDFVKFGGQTYRVYPAGQEEPLTNEALPQANQ